MLFGELYALYRVMRRVYVPARVSVEHWSKILELARSERVSGQSALNLVVERGLVGAAAHELSRLSAERLGAGVEGELRKVLRS